MEKFSSFIIALIFAFLGLMFIKTKKIVENFLPPMAVSVDRVAAPNRDFADKGMFWSVPGTFQPTVTPRSASVQYGAQMVNHLPDSKHLAFDGKSPFANPGVPTSDGDFMQPVTFDRFMYANKKSRRRTGGDPIRGDLPIIPQNTGWFRPSVQPHLDLKEGALTVLGGFDNETNATLAALMKASSGNSMATFGGMAFSGTDSATTNFGEFFGNSNTSRQTPNEAMKRMSELPQMQSKANSAFLGSTINSNPSFMSDKYVSFNSPDGTVVVNRM
jgi:hypothetical protein